MVSKCFMSSSSVCWGVCCVGVGREQCWELGGGLLSVRPCIKSLQQCESTAHRDRCVDIIIENAYRRMIKYYTNKEYRKVYRDLQELGLLNTEGKVDYQQYERYLRELVIRDPLIDRQAEILSRATTHPNTTIKTLIFLHSWLQTTCLVENTAAPLGLLNSLLSNITRYSLTSAAPKSASNAVMNQNSVSRRAFSKESFMLQDVARPYIHYLQKAIAQFDFYKTLKKGLGKPLQQSEAWALLNLIKCATSIAAKIPLIWKLVRKSYLPVSEGVAQALNTDLHHYYPKLQKYCLSQVAGLSARAQNGLECKQQLALLACMVEEVGQVNLQIKALYRIPLFKQHASLYQPRYINPRGAEFDILHQENNMTPVFPTVTNPTIESYRHPLPPIFSDITNSQDQWSFRRKGTLAQTSTKEQSTSN